MNSRLSDKKGVRYHNSVLQGSLEVYQSIERQRLKSLESQNSDGRKHESKATGKRVPRGKIHTSFMGISEGD